MDSQILSELANIRWLLTGVLVCLGFLLVIIIALANSHLRIKKAEIKTKIRNLFISEAHQYEDSGEFEKLFQLADKRSQQYPHDPCARWFLAIAHYKKKEWAYALAVFKDLQQLDPAWEKFAVQDYIIETQKKLSGPIGTTS